MNRAAHKLYGSLIAAAMSALPKDSDQRVRQFMRKKVGIDLGIDQGNTSYEMGLLGNLWAALGYQDALRHLCAAMMVRSAAHEGRDSPTSMSRALLAWPAEYANLTGYAQLFNRTNTPPFPLSREIEDPIFTDPDEFNRDFIGTPQSPGSGWGHKDVVYPMRLILDDMYKMGMHRLATSNDWGWDRDRFNQELELHATNLRQFLGYPATKPHMPTDPHVYIPDGFTHFPDQYGTEPMPDSNHPLPGLEHLPTPIPTNNPLPPGILPNYPHGIPTGANATTPTPAAPTAPTEPAPVLPPTQLPGPDADPTPTWAHIEKLLVHEADTLLAPGATQDELNELEQELGYPLPPQLRTTLTRHNGTLDDHPDLPGHQLLSTQEIAEEHAANTDAYEDTNNEILASPTPYAATNFTPHTTQPGIWNTHWIPITTDGTGTNHVLDTNPGPAGHTGQILTITTDTPPTGPTYPSYAALLTTWANNLRDSQ